MSSIRRLRREDSGATSIEYALIASLIALVIVAGLTSVGTSLSSAFAKVSGGFP